jgi:hypothetical protein
MRYSITLARAGDMLPARGRMVRAGRLAVKRRGRRHEKAPGRVAMFKPEGEFSALELSNELSHQDAGRRRKRGQPVGLKLLPGKKLRGGRRWVRWGEGSVRWKHSLSGRADAFGSAPAPTLKQTVQL